MTWIQVKIQTQRDQTEQVENLLSELGSPAIMLLDAGDQPLLEPPPGATPLWDSVWVQGLFSAESDMDALLEFLAQQLDGQITTLRAEVLEDKDWERAWMDHYHPMAFGKRLWVVPSWTPPPCPDAVNLLLDPGLAFGTGTHATTSLCLNWLDSLELSDKTVMDYGCGSGILAIAALLLGARHAIAVDNDPQALLSTQENARRNGVLDRLVVYLPEEVPDELKTSCDVVVANILAKPLIHLAELLCGYLRPLGELALSGLIRSQVEDVSCAYNPWIQFSSPEFRDEDWCRLQGKRRIA